MPRNRGKNGVRRNGGAGGGNAPPKGGGWLLFCTFASLSIWLSDKGSTKFDLSTRPRGLPEKAGGGKKTIKSLILKELC